MSNQYDQNLKKQKELAQRYLDIIGSMLIALDEKGRITLFNKKACKVLGWTEQEALGKSWFELCVPQNARKEIKRVFKQLMAGEMSSVEYYENPLLTKSAEQRIIAFHNVSSVDDAGRIIGILFSGEDITEHKQIEMERKKLFMLAESSSEFIGMCGLDMIPIYVNPAGQRMVGLPDLEAACQVKVKDYFFPEDQRLIVEEFFPNVMREGKGEIEIRLRHFQTAKPIWMSYFLFSVQDETGTPVGWATVSHDITERKKGDDDLKDAKAHAEGVIENARDAFVAMDEQGIVTDWNPEAGRMFGFSKSEAVGKPLVDIIIPPEFRDAHTAGLKHYLDTGEAKVLNTHVEITALHKNGSVIPVELSISPMEQGGSVTFNAFIRDLTERNKAKVGLVKGAESLRKSLVGTVQVIAKAVEARDPYTAGHQQRVSQLARSIAQEMRLDRQAVEGIRMGASVHDIGKIHLPAEILSKPAKLSATEYLLIQDHPQVGYDILKDIEFPWPLADIAHQHHERMDGSGYPQGLKGDEICLEARIVAVADVVEAMSSHRPYRAGLGIELALEEVKKGRGSLYDPNVVDACLKLFAENRFTFKEVKNS